MDMVPDVEYAAYIWWNKLDKATRRAMMNDHPDAYHRMPQGERQQCIVNLYENRDNLNRDVFNLYF